MLVEKSYGQVPHDTFQNTDPQSFPAFDDEWRCFDHQAMAPRGAERVYGSQSIFSPWDHLPLNVYGSFI